MHTAKLAASLLVLLAFVVGAAPARAETVNCTAITALPAIITVQGVYCFTGDLITSMTSGAAIDIQADNVVLDLNGFKLGGLGGGTGTGATGINSNNRQNITIKNGTVRGFLYGILLGGSGSQGLIVEDIRADQNTYIGIYVLGDGNIVRNNQVVATGGTTCCGANPDAYGILVVGDDPRVLNNDVINIVRQGSGWAVAIRTDSPGGLVVNNRITGAKMGIYIRSDSGKYRDNLTFDVDQPFVGGTDAGNNN